MPSNRRRFLGLSAGLVAGLAGCVSDGPGTGDAISPMDSTDTGPAGTDPTDTDGKPTDGSETPTDPPSDAKRTVGDATVAVTDVVARKAVTYASIMGSGGVVVRPGTQFVVASVHSEAELTMESFSFVANGEEWTASMPGDHGAVNAAVEGHRGAPVGTQFGIGPEVVVFELPSPLDPDEPRIRCERDGESAEWSLPDEATAALPAPAPAFELDSLEAPDSVEQGETMAVTLSATSVSDTDGRFLAALYWPTDLIADDDESRIVEADVAAGESVTESVEIDTGYTTSEDGPVELRVEGHVEASTAVRVTGAGTDA